MKLEMKQNAAAALPESQRNTGGLLTALGLAKRYGATKALVNGSVTLHAGSITGLVGENGSGKSTLVKVLSGVTSADQGTIDIGGESRVGFRGPAEAKRMGIATVLQEILVSPARSVLENIYLGADWGRRSEGFDQCERRAGEVLRALGGEEVDLEMPVECLPISHQQIVTISRALVQRPRVLILDEATSALDVGDRDRLFAHCRELRRSGVAILFISHRLEELLALADSIVVMRNGETLTSDDAMKGLSVVSRESLLAAMSGERQPESAAQPVRRTVERHARATTVLRASGIDLGAGAIDWELSSGAIVGLAGLEGHGQEQFLRALAGIEAPAGGRVWRVSGEGSAPVRSQRDAARGRIAYLPRSRSRDGIFPTLSVLDNFALPTLERSTSFGLIRRRALHQRFEVARHMLHIRAASAHALVTTLSGGNQQKVLLARWLAAEPEILMLDDPTRGVDVPTKEDLHNLLRQRAQDGVAVVIISTELEEFEGLCDSVVVFHEGRVSACLDSGHLAPAEILAAMFGERA